ncbi:MAG: alpha/beta hydrolase, partial [Acinetobacter sp.]
MYLSNLLKSSILILMLSGCQNVQTNSKVIATAFDTSTHFQRIFLDHFAPENISITANVTYQNDPQLSLDIYQSQDIQQLGKRPTIVWIHGGGWISGAKDKARGYFKLLAAQGYNVVSVQYTFAPEAMYPTQLHEINNALEFLTQHSKQYNIDTNQLFLAGD